MEGEKENVQKILGLTAKYIQQDFKKSSDLDLTMKTDSEYLALATVYGDTLVLEIVETIAFDKDYTIAKATAYAQAAADILYG